MPQTFNLLNFSVPDTEFHCIRTLAKMCCKPNPIDRPDLQEVYSRAAVQSSRLTGYGYNYI